MRVQDRPVYKLKAAQDPLKVEVIAELLKDDISNYSKLISNTLLQWCVGDAMSMPSTHTCLSPRRLRHLADWQHQCARLAWMARYLLSD